MRAGRFIATLFVVIYALFVLGALLMLHQEMDCDNAGEALHRPSRIRAGQCEVQLHNGQWARYDELNIHVSKR